jgi:hypothetical protein
VTNDLDIVVGLDLLASEGAQRAIVQAMERNKFTVVELNPRWQFSKQLDLDRQVFVDLHAELPESEYQNLKLDRLRIKHWPWLGDEGVHAVRHTASFTEASEACNQLFLKDGGWGVQVAAQICHDNDLDVIRTTLSDWFCSTHV